MESFSIFPTKSSPEKGYFANNYATNTYDRRAFDR